MASPRIYPIGIQTFENIRNGNYAYVDKTGLVYSLTHRYKYVFLSRPRRFGKSLLCSTLKSYFEGRRDLFEERTLKDGTRLPRLALADLEQEWTQHPVLLVSLSTVKLGTEEDFNVNVGHQLFRLEERYGIKKTSDELSQRFRNLIEQTTINSGQPAVVILDEYDAPLLSCIDEEESLRTMRRCLRAFYSCLKDCDPYLRFVFITGITKFSQLSIFSEINNLKNVSMFPEYSAICGVSQREIEEQLHDDVVRLGEVNNLDYAGALERLKENYDGYHFSHKSEDIYNPFSLINCLDEGAYNNFWFTSGTPSSLIHVMRQFQTDITQLDGIEVEAGQFDVPTEGMESALPMLYQSGYLTIKGYNDMMEFYRLGIPNKEVRIGLANSLIPRYVSPRVDETKTTLFALCRAIMADDINLMFSTLQTYLAGVPYAEGATSEGHFRTMLYIIFQLLGRWIETEVRTATGRIDVVLKTKTAIYVMELKMDHTAQEALQQIDQKGYLIPYTLDGRPLHKVGISFSLADRTITEWVVA